MIFSHKVPGCLLQELPEIIGELKYMYPSKGIYKTIQCLTNYTSHVIMLNDFKKVVKCFEVIEKLYSQGDPKVREAIEKTFFHSCCIFIHIWNEEQTTKLQFIMPLNLRNAMCCG